MHALVSSVARAHNLRGAQERRGVGKIHALGCLTDKRYIARVTAGNGLATYRWMEPPSTLSCGRAQASVDRLIRVRRAARG